MNREDTVRDMKIITDRAEAIKALTQRPSKYGVKTDARGKAARTIDNIVFDSLKEARRYSELKILERAGEISGLRCHVTYPLIVKGVQINGRREHVIGSYELDFLYTDRAGKRHHEDAKGFRTREFIRTKKLMLALFGIVIEET